jgi:hypothetical protein
MIGPGLAGIGNLLADAHLSVPPRCIYWLDSPWITTRGEQGGELAQAPGAATMLGFDAVVLQTERDRAAVTTSMQTFAPLADRWPTLHVLAAVPNIDELEKEAGILGLDPELAAWRDLPHRLTTSGNHLPRRNMHGQLLSFAHLLDTRPDLLGRTQLFIHVQPAAPAETTSAEISALRKTCAVVNQRFGLADWRPVVLRESRDRPLEMDLLRHCTVLLAVAASEGMGFPPLQLLGINDRAIAIVSRHTGANEMAGHHLLIADAGSIESMSSQMARAIDMSPTQVRDLVAGAKAGVRDHSTNAWATQMVDQVIEPLFHVDAGES